MNSQSYPASLPHHHSLDSSKRLLSLATVFGSSALLLVGNGRQQRDFSANQKRSDEARKNHPHGGEAPPTKRIG